MPFLIALIVGVIVVGGAGYIAVKQYQNKQIEGVKQQPESPTIQNEQVTSTQEISEIEKLRQEVEDLKKEQARQSTAQNQKQPQSGADTINASDIENFLFYVGKIGCLGTSGSSKGTGVLINVNGSAKVLTNRHVITGSLCTFQFTHKTYGFKNYGLDVNNLLAWNTITDSVVVSLKNITKYEDPLLNQLTSPIKAGSSCRQKMPLGSSVVIIGYPVTTQYISGQLEIPEYGVTIDRTENPQTVITGIISAYDESVLRELPDVNYFTTAPMDSGNSGGLALSKINGEVCILGIPTWAAVGNFQNQGVVQSMSNIFFTP